MPGDDLWTTVRCERVVLAVVRTVTTATRLLDVLELVRGDPRVQVVFTFERSSAFTAGVTKFIEDNGGHVLPWDEAVRGTFDLAISASENGALHELSAPLLLLPHGAGHHKYAKGTRRISGYRFGSSPRAIVLSHRSQLDQLAAAFPAALPRAVVARDVCLDRLRASLPHRARYRRALGNTGQRLVVLSSTWGRASAFGRAPGLALELLAALPRDEYQVALVLHPNIWFAHSRFAVRGWLGAAMDAGLLVIPPEEGWRAALVAADLLIGDHGSVSLYAAAIGLPVLLAAFGSAEVVEDTPMASLGARAPRLGHGPLLGQVQAASRQDTAPLRAIADEVFAGDAPGLRSVLYSLIELDPGGAPAPAGHVGDPVPETRHVGAHRVIITALDDKTVGMQRFSASLPETGAADQHIAADEDCFDAALVRGAAVILGVTDDFEEWAGRVFAEHPAARVAAAGDLVLHRDWDGPRRVTGGLALAASAVCAGYPQVDGSCTVVLGDREVPVHLTG
ncbi:hypothetical protein SAMN05216188_12812 [Lentzea xinjiangensis]|uniref:CDP-Glycerol:Poly(Glycerophosphate) glycerophosphotransferase n=1 Tax=Lentzea xinjiangensis TaxID=402600 RepID=A0A1H9VUX8_9PSEU|nr:hypothetical protein [Lentzea xinjiangensis]SES25083.1 hypothetical protein SAMN05216188_12812 [Lentzea xinjiangensis]